MSRTDREDFPAYLCSEKGLTLVEIIVVLIILSIVGTFLMGNVLNAGDKAKLMTTKLKMTQLKGAIDTYQLMHNSLPNRIDDLMRCDEKAGTSCFPVATQEQIVDAWGTTFTYSIETGTRRYKITSLGADGKQGGSNFDGDISESGP